MVLTDGTSDGEVRLPRRPHYAGWRIGREGNLAALLAIADKRAFAFCRLEGTQWRTTFYRETPEYNYDDGTKLAARMVKTLERFARLAVIKPKPLRPDTCPTGGEPCQSGADPAQHDKAPSLACTGAGFPVCPALRVRSIRTVQQPTGEQENVEAYTFPAKTSTRSPRCVVTRAPAASFVTQGRWQKVINGCGLMRQRSTGKTSLPLRGRRNLKLLAAQ